MKRLASEVLRDLEIRIARLEKEADPFARLERQASNSVIFEKLYVSKNRRVFFYTIEEKRGKIVGIEVDARGIPVLESYSERDFRNTFEVLDNAGAYATGANEVIRDILKFKYENGLGSRSFPKLARLERISNEAFNPAFEKLHDLLSMGGFGPAKIRNLKLRKNSSGQTELEWDLNIDPRELTSEYDDGEFETIAMVLREYVFSKLERYMYLKLFVDFEGEGQLDISIEPRDSRGSKSYLFEIFGVYADRGSLNFTLTEKPHTIF